MVSLRESVLKIFHYNFDFHAGTSHSGKIEVDDAGLVSAYGNVSLRLSATILPCRFKLVTGDFLCSKNNLTSLLGSPFEVMGDFDARENELETLEGFPKTVGGVTWVNHNKLNSLKGVPNISPGSFFCYKNQLSSLEGGPDSVNGDFRCDINNLTNLKGAPTKVSGYFTCIDTPLTSLDGAPREMAGFWGPYHKNLPLLRTLVADEIGLYPTLNEDARAVKNILMKYAGQGKRALFDCQKELEDSGYEGNAKW
jgi:hypothetical protein